MVIKMVFQSIFWVNAFTHKHGIYKTISPRTIITGKTIDYNSHFRIKFGQYVQTHEKHDNSMMPRTIGTIALRPTGNKQGGYFFYSLLSGEKIHRTHWTDVPMPEDVKDRLHAMARRAKADQGLSFTDRTGTDLDDL